METVKPFNTRSWYGMPTEIAVGRVWHWVKGGPVPLPHPGLVDLHLRRGLPYREGMQLNYWHELGHIETLHLALLHGLALWLVGRKREAPRWLRVLIGLLAWMAGWELFAEFYAMGRAGPEYAHLYRRANPPLPLAFIFWIGMGALAIGGTLWMWLGSGGRRARR